jgi:hypothetical protein
MKLTPEQKFLLALAAGCEMDTECVAADGSFRSIVKTRWPVHIIEDEDGTVRVIECRGLMH